MSHTPGPWTAQSYGESNGQALYRVVTPTHELVAESLSREDAQLVVAALEMQDLLANFVIAYETREHQLGNGTARKIHELARKLLARIDAHA